MTETLTERLTAERAEADRKRALPSPTRRRQIRLAAGVSQAAAAEAVGVSRPALAAYEAGTRTPRGDHLVRYLQVLDSLARKPA